MRKISKLVGEAFATGKAFSRSSLNTHTDGMTVWLHFNPIIRYTDASKIHVEISLAGWDTPTTRARISDIMSLMNIPAAPCHVKGEAMLWNYQTRTKTPMPVRGWIRVS